MVGLAWLPVVPCEREALGEWCLWVDRVEVSRRPKRSWKQKSNRGKGLLGPLLPNGHPEKTTWYRPKYRTYNLCCRLALPRRRQSFCCRRLLDQKNLAARLPLRSAAHLHISHETAWISRECPEDFFKTGKIFSRELFQSEDDKIGKIARKLTRTSKEKSHGFSNILNPLFITLCTSLLPFRLRCCVTKRRARLLEKREKQQISTQLNNISKPPCCDVTLLFRTFPKVE